MQTEYHERTGLKSLLEEGLSDEDVKRRTAENLLDPRVSHFTVTKNRHERRAEAAQDRKKGKSHGNKKD